MNKKLLPVAVTICMVLSFLLAIPAGATVVHLPPVPEELWSYNTTCGVTDVAIGDVNGDGKDDVVSIEACPVNLHVISGDGPPPLWSKPIQGFAVAVGDITGDGEPEVIAGAWNSTGWVLNAYDKDGNLLWPYPTVDEVTDIEIGDVDDDGIDDVVACNDEVAAVIYAINGTGQDVTGWPVVIEGEHVIDLAVGQLDGKGGVDVVAIGPGPACLYAYNSTGGLMWQDVNVSGRTVEIGDVDGDGDNEVVFAYYGDAPVGGGLGGVASGSWIYAFDGDEGGPPLYSFYTEDYKIISDIELGDLDGNPKDVEVAAITEPIDAMLFAVDIDSSPDGQEMWRYPIDWPPGPYYGESLAIGDVDRDYKNEVVAAQSEEPHYVYAFDGIDRNKDGQGDLVWSPYEVILTGEGGITDLEIGDLDGDGDQDVAFGDFDVVSGHVYAITAVESKTETATGTGTVYFDSDPSTLEGLTAVPESSLPEEGKPDLEFPHGFFSFNITLPSTNYTSAIVTMTFPSPLPVGTQYWKYGPTPSDPTDHWYQLPVGDDDGDDVITITLVDGGLGDDVVGAPDGFIVEPGGPGFPVPPVGGEAYPVSRVFVLAPWIVLGVILVAVAAFMVLRKKQAARRS
jgi:hypothetical protein